MERLFQIGKDTISKIIKELFFSSGGSNYIVSAMSGSVKKYYLINKSALPKEIRDGLKGGDSYQYVDYINFIDIYGVTEDLKVYYCENGIIEGASYGQLDGSAMNPNTPLVKVNENDNLKKAISSALGITDSRDITVGDIQSLKTLTLNNSEITSVEGLSEAYGLKNLTLENLDIANLNGIEACTLLEKIYFKNSKIENYTKLENCINLKELYMYLPPTWESEECDNQVLYLCQGLQNASKITGLLELGISGELTMLEYFDSNFRVETKKGNIASASIDGEGSKLSTLNSLSLINPSVKNSIKYLYLNNNDLSEDSAVESLGEFGGVKILTLMNNKGLQKVGNLEKCLDLECIFLYRCCTKNQIEDTLGNITTTYSGLNDISGIKNLPSLKSLYIWSNYALSNLGYLNTNSKLSKILAYSCNITDITGLNSMTSLNTLSLYSNINLYSISTIGTLTSLTTLYLANNENMNSEEIAPALDTSGIMLQCGSNFSIPDKYKSLFTSLLSDQRLADSGLTDDSEIITKFKTRADVTNIVTLDLSGNSNLSDNCLQTILKRMKNLRCLSLKDCSNLASLDFISEGNVEGLYELDLRGTSITDLSNLESYGTALDALLLDNYDVDFSKIQNVVSNYLYSGKQNKIGISIRSNNDTAGCFGLLLDGDVSQYNFPSTCSSINNFRIMDYSGFSESVSGILDLSSLPNLENYLGRYEPHQIKMPASLKNFTRQGGSRKADLSLCKNLDYVCIDSIAGGIADGILKTLTIMPTEFKFWRKDSLKNWKFLTRVIDSETGEMVDCSRLKIITIGGSSSEVNTITSLSGMENATELEELYLYTNMGINDYSVISKFAKLKKLVFANAKNGVESLNLLNNEGKAFTNSLDFLVVANNTSITSIIGLDKYTTLITLKIYSTGVSDITGLSNNIGITTLDLHDNQISDLEELDKLIENCGETGVGFDTLDLSDNSIGYFSNSGTDNAQVILNLKAAGVETINVKGNTVANSNKLANISGIITK